MGEHVLGAWVGVMGRSRVRASEGWGAGEVVCDHVCRVVVILEVVTYKPSTRETHYLANTMYLPSSLPPSLPPSLLPSLPLLKARCYTD